MTPTHHFFTFLKNSLHTLDHSAFIYEMRARLKCKHPRTDLNVVPHSRVTIPAVKSFAERIVTKKETMKEGCGLCFGGSFLSLSLSLSLFLSFRFSSLGANSIQLLGNWEVKA